MRFGRIRRVASKITATIIRPMNSASTMPEVKASFHQWTICCEMSSGNCPAAITTTPAITPMKGISVLIKPRMSPISAVRIKKITNTAFSQVICRAHLF
jgi:hypothetical protein